MCFFFFQAEDGIRDVERSRGLGDVYKRQGLPDFKMPAFLRLLEKRANEIDEQLSETLISLSDFMVFKQLILEYKDRHSGKALDLCLSGTSAHLHDEEQSDGDERPDIMLDIRPLKKAPQLLSLIHI
eukprot:TRINITY_DN21842_c0_g1_i2.p3 TRINITY_DN21842_c0_g1~~TRINITY_DN21842_c0_g1_i2.p3  ORF type:complete len:127 (+),score=31.89 TRINITY_DN21842_c0_g1_i2:131-511(+)